MWSARASLFLRGQKCGFRFSAYATAAVDRSTAAKTAYLDGATIQKLGRNTRLPIHQAKFLHPFFYANEAYVKAEEAAIFGKHWFAAAHTSELANPGDVKVIEVGNTSIILTRDKQNKLHALYNVCRHRGARLCSSNQTNCKQLVCPYHWWSYRLDGSLKATPPETVSQERKDDLSLLSVPGLETFAGIIFLNQASNPDPLANSLGDLPEKFARYDFDTLELHAMKDYVIGGNWKLIGENFIDFYHVKAVHPELAEFAQVHEHVPYQGDGNYVGYAASPLADSGGPDDPCNFNIFPRLNDFEKSSALFFHIFPNISVTLYPHSVYTLISFPGKNPLQTQEQLTLLMAKGAQLHAEPDIEYQRKCNDLMRFATTINDEDVVAIENLQKGLVEANTRGLQGELLPKYDWPIHRLQNLALASIQATLEKDSMQTLKREAPLTLFDNIVSSNIEVRTHPKYGEGHHGVFAKTFIKKGEELGRVPQTAEGEELKFYTRSEAMSLREEVRRHMYMVDDELFGIPEPPLAYLNHSCDPNCWFQGDDLFVVAQDIQENEEIVFDYSLGETEGSMLLPLNCKCGAADCRGDLKFDDWRNAHWRHKYAGRYNSYIAKKIASLPSDEQAAHQ